MTQPSPSDEGAPDASCHAAIPGRVNVAPGDFERLVAETMDSLPDWVMPILTEVAVLVEDEEPAATRRPGRTLLGRYRGIPRASYGSRPPGTLPDTITLYRLAILNACTSTSEVPGRVRSVLLHELGHAYGLDERRLRELGVY